jgi:YD repeat-containing protein
MKNNKINGLFAPVFFFRCALAVSQVQTPPIKDPHVEAFTIFGDIPVSHTTGVTDISIPLFNLESHGYILPVTLRYHTALIKPPYDHTNVATGWILDVGGSIVQTINNVDDFLGKRPASWENDYDLSDQNAESTWLYTSMAVNGSYDCEYDIFSYSIPGSNGKFIVNKNTTGKYDAVFLSDPNLKGNIDIENSEYSYTVNNFIITDKNGYNYKFVQKSNINTPFYMLDTLYSPNGQALFNFEYSNVFNYVYDSNYIGLRHYILPIATEVIEGSIPYSTPTSGDLYSYFATGLSPDSWKGTTIKKVYFDNGSLIFSSDTSTNNRYIIGVCLRDANGILKNVEFEIGNFPGSGYRYLNKILIKDANQKVISEYSFDYYHKDRTVSNSTLNLDYFGYLTWGSRGLQGKFIDIEPRTFDYMRYSNSGSIVQAQITIGTGENKKPNLEYAQTYALKSITYPTKGRTEFVYGLNQYFDATTQNGGGIRIEKITNYDENNKKVSVKTIQYETGEVDFDFHASGDNFKMAYEIGGFYDLDHHTGSTTKTSVQQINHNIINPEVSKEVRYSKVTEFIGTQDDNNGKTTYEYKFFNPHVYNCFDVSYNGSLFGGVCARYIYEYRDWDNPQLTKKTVFRNNDGAYDTVSTENLTYTKMDLRSFDNVKFYNYANYGGNSAYENYSRRYLLIKEDGVSPSILPTPYIAYSYTIKAGTIRLTSKVTTLYNNDGTRISTAESYNYDKGFDKFLTSREVANSDSKVTKTFFKYPYDVSSEVTNEMVKRNILSPIIEETNKINNTVLESTRTNYKNWGNNIIAPETVVTTRNSQNDTRLHYISYDTKGNMTSVSKDQDVISSYIWGYNQTYPVVKIEGKAFADISSTIISAVNGHSFRGKTNYQNIKADKEDLQSILSSLLNDNSINVYLYTYAPLIGMTSETNPNGVTTYYEYDGFGRLKAIKNDDGNILKTYDYRYYNQDAFYNREMSQSFTRNNCAFGYAGSSVTYTVPADKYSSNISQADADNKALADITLNGQNYANTNGICTLKPTTSISVTVTSGESATIIFTSGSTVKTFTVGSGGTITVPKGTYNVSISLTGCSGNHMFSIMGVTTYSGSCGTTFSSISLQASAYTILISRL